MTMNVTELHGREEPWDVNAVRRDITVDTASGRTDKKSAAINPSADSSNADSKKKRSWKKPKDKPMRPLSAYNMFFQNQRERIVGGKTGDPTPEEIHQSIIKMLTSKTRGPKRRQDRISHGQISFGDLARTIAAKWKAINPKLKAVYNHYAAQEKVRYKKEVVIWKEKKEKELAANQNSLLTSSSTFNDSLASMSSSATSMSTSMTSYNMTESINSLRGDAPVQLNDDVVQRQQNILRQQMGFIDNKSLGRMNEGGNDVPREISKADLGGSGSENIGSHEFFPRPIGGNGKAGGMTMLGSNNSNVMNTGEDFNRGGSFLDSTLQQHSQQQQQNLNKEHLLLQLQQQQLQQLQQLQQARNESSRLSNMKTTDTVSTFLNSVQASKMNGNQSREYPPPSLTTSSTSKPNQMMQDFFNDDPKKSEQIIQDQIKELEGITSELKRLKEQERQMQEKIQENMQRSNANMWSGNDNNRYGNSNNNVTPSVTTSGNYDSSKTYMSLNDTGDNFSSRNVGSSLRSTFDADIDDRQRIPVRRSRKGDTSVYRIYRGISSGGARGDPSHQRQPRRHSMFGTGDTGLGNNAVFSPNPNSYTFGQRNPNESILPGRQRHQPQNNHDDRRDSLAGLLQLDDNNQRRRRQQQQQQEPSLATLLQDGAANDLGSLFNMDLQD